MEWIGMRWLRTVGINSLLRVRGTGYNSRRTSALLAELQLATCTTGLSDMPECETPGFARLKSMQPCGIAGNGSERWMFQDVCTKEAPSLFCGIRRPRRSALLAATVSGKSPTSRISNFFGWRIGDLTIESSHGGQQYGQSPTAHSRSRRRIRHLAQPYTLKG